MAANLPKPSTDENISTTLAAGLTDVAGSVDVSDASKIDFPCYLVIDRVDSAGALKSTSLWEYVKVTNVSGNTLTITRGQGGSTAQSHSSGAVVEAVVTSTMFEDWYDVLNPEHDSAGGHVIVGTATIAGMNLLSVATISVGSLNVLNVITRISASGASITGEFPSTSSSILTTTKYAPQGFLLNGKIVPSVASNNLTVAIKGMDGNDPSASNPVYVRIGDTVRTITAALSVTKNAGTNYFNSGGAELATKEVDYFVYLGYNATDGVVIGFARIPYVSRYDGFSTTSTAETYCAISTITNAAAADGYELIGRFAATLSAGAGYTWSVPTFTATNLIQKPIFETRLLTYVPTIAFVATGSPSTVSASNHKYRISGGAVYVNAYVAYSSAGNAVTSINFTLPFANAVNRFLAGGTVYPAATRNVAYFYSDSKLYVDCSSIALTEVGAAGTYHLA
jgi:hypothetical protein